MTQSYAYDGEQTCAADGMCQEKCPVKINTGDMIKVREMRVVMCHHCRRSNTASFKGHAD